MDQWNKDSSLHFLDYWRVLRVRWPLTLVVFLGVLFAAGLATVLVPLRYDATAIVEIRGDNFLLHLGGGGIGPARADPRQLATQFEIFQTVEVLQPVVDSLDLVERWRADGVADAKSAQARLRGMLRFRDVRNTDLIQITARGADPDFVAEVANAVAAAYEQVRILQVDGWIGRSLAALDAEVDKQREEVVRLRRIVTELGERHGIVDLAVDFAAGVEAPHLPVHLATERTVGLERMQVAALRARQETLSGMDDWEILRGMAGLGIQDPILLELFAGHQVLVAERAQTIEAGLGRRHPSVSALDARLAELERQLQDQVRALRVSLADQLRLAEQSLAALEAELGVSRAAYHRDGDDRAAHASAKQAHHQALTLLRAAEARANAERLQLGMPQNPAIVWQRAEPPLAPSHPRVVLNMVFGSVLAVALGVGAAFALEYLDTSVKTLAEAEAVTGLPVLAVLPRSEPSATGQRTLDAEAEAFRILRANIELNPGFSGSQSFAVTSGGTGEGKSTVAANLALQFAVAGYRTLLVDADIRRPVQHVVFGLAPEPGLANCLAGDVPVMHAVRPGPVENLFVLPSGLCGDKAAALDNSHALGALLTEVERRYELILLDAPPILGVSDAGVLASLADAVLIVVQHRRFPKSMLQRVVRAITAVGARPLGLVLNRTDIRHDPAYSHYQGAGYSAHPQRAQRPEPFLAGTGTT